MLCKVLKDWGMDAMDRRDFLKKGLAAAAGLGLSSVLGDVEGAPEKGTGEGRGAEIVVARGGAPAEVAARAVGALGGMGRFVRRGARVVVKPNIGWDRTVEEGANTHPDVVASLVRLCRAAGAREVVVTDTPCNAWAATSVKSGIADAVRRAGGVLKAPGPYRKVALPGARVLVEAEILEDVLDADLVINAPVVKVHSSQALVTVSMKNLMGVVKDRGFFHRTDLSRCIAEIAAFVRPRLTVLDATRILLTRGPAGPGEVRVLDTVAAGTDFVALDALGATYLGVKPGDVRHIRMAAELGLGEADLDKVRIRTV